MATQLRAPNPNIPCTPGWCLTYVQQAFGAGWAGASATDGWNRVRFRHADENYPVDVAVPVWFGLTNNVNGHVVIRMPDGSVYSSSHPTSNVPYHHPSMAHLMSYYGGRLQLRGWSEDIGDLKVISLEEKTMAKITTEAVVALSMATTGRMPQDSNETQYVNQEATQANLDGLITQWSSKSRIPALEAQIKDLQATLDSQGFKPLGQEVYVKK